LTCGSLSHVLAKASSSTKLRDVVATHESVLDAGGPVGTIAVERGKLFVVQVAEELCGVVLMGKCLT
jgi:hypothetical protein